jgi:hypothetical protein
MSHRPQRLSYQPGPAEKVVTINAPKIGGSVSAKQQKNAVTAHPRPHPLVVAFAVGAAKEESCEAGEK